MHPLLVDLIAIDSPNAFMLLKYAEAMEASCKVVLIDIYPVAPTSSSSLGAGFLDPLVFSWLRWHILEGRIWCLAL